MSALRRRGPPCRPAGRSYAGRRSQRGVALLVVALLSALVGLIAMSQMSSVGGLFRTARDDQDVSLARQAAEAALRDAEADVACMQWQNGAWSQVLAPTNKNNHCVSAAPHCSEMMPTKHAVAIRVLDGNPSQQPRTDWPKDPKELTQCTSGDWALSGSGKKLSDCAVDLGSKTGAPKFSGVARPPQYHVDVFDVSINGSGLPVPLFRITARGYGGTADTYSELQEVYRPCR